MSIVSDAVQDQVFRNARTQNGFTDQPITDAELRAVYDLAKWGPTSMNTQPARYQFLRTQAAKDRLVPCMAPGNQPKVAAAPVVVIIGHDLEFYEHLAKNFAYNPNARGVFAGNEALIQGTAFRNGTLQGAYLMVAARMLGLDCGPMSGFDAARVDAEFWAGSKVKTNFICNLGHGDPSKVMGRLPRFDFDAICKLL
ncbi:MAG: malonic semialdehyde reductase [Burkholderiales bacterium]